MITLNSLTGATTDETQRIDSGLEGLNAVWITKAFADAVLAHTKLDGTLGFECTDETNQQILDNLQKAFAAGISIDDYVYSPSFWQRFHNNVVGYEDANGAIHQNRTFLDSYTRGDIGDNLGHETCHKIGYHHNGNSPTDENLKSVPYGIGQIVNDLITLPN